MHMNMNPSRRTVQWIGWLGWHMYAEEGLIQNLCSNAVLYQRCIEKIVLTY